MGFPGDSLLPFKALQDWHSVYLETAVVALKQFLRQYSRSVLLTEKDKKL